MLLDEYTFTSETLVIHIQILGKVKHYKCFGGGKSKIDMKKT